MANNCENKLTVSGVNVKAFVDQAKSTNGDESPTPLSFANFIPALDTEEGLEAWGTKWDASEVDMEEDETEVAYMFNTPWTPPELFVQRVSKDFPQLTFTLWYEEGTLFFTGESVYQNGVEVSRKYSEDEYSREYWEISGSDPELEHRIGLKVWTVHLEDIHGDVLDTTEVDAYTQQEAEELGDTVFRESDLSETYPPIGYKACAYADKKAEAEGEVIGYIDLGKENVLRMKAYVDAALAAPFVEAAPKVNIKLWDSLHATLTTSQIEKALRHAGLTYEDWMQFIDDIHAGRR